jgi:predicted lipid-binding transport protein (Tim44 family)
MVEWKRRLDDFAAKGWHNRVSVRGKPEIQYVGLVNREDDTEDRAVVRVTARLTAYVETRDGRHILRTGAKSENVGLCEYWTLARSGSGDAWRVVSIESRAEGDHQLDEEIVASPWADSRIADESLTELAAEDGLPEGFTTADLATVSFEGTAREHALDLSLADARFAPDVLAAAARRAVAAWAEAVDGEDAALEAVATPEAVSELLYGGDTTRKTRVVVRGPRVRAIKILAVDVDHDPATMTIEVELGGRRYVEDRDTAAVVAGSKEHASSVSESWTLALDGPRSVPWRVVGVGASGRQVD